MRLNSVLANLSVEESGIRRISRLAKEARAINLSQGFPDFQPDKGLLDAFAKADRHQYSPPMGLPGLRKAIARKMERYNGIDASPDDITVTCGATEGLKSILEATCNPGDEVAFFEPHHEMYGAQAKLLRLRPVPITLSRPGWTFAASDLESAISDNTAAFILNTPHNPTGRVFGKEELGQIAEACKAHDTLIIADEIYEHILFGGAEHISMATLPGMAERTFTVSAVTKTYSLTGWRVGWVHSPSRYTPFVRAAHDVSVIQAPTPLQQASAFALGIDEGFYTKLRTDYEARREVAMPFFGRKGFLFEEPQGAYYLMADFSGLSDEPADKFAMSLIYDAGVAGVPGSNFYSTPVLGNHEIRFAFCKNQDTLREAGRRLDSWIPEKTRETIESLRQWEVVAPTCL